MSDEQTDELYADSEAIHAEDEGFEDAAVAVDTVDTGTDQSVEENDVLARDLQQVADLDPHDESKEFQMKGRRLLRSIRITNFLSFGEDSDEIQLLPLNVIIGRNGSGKSNFIEAIGLLNQAPKDLTNPIRAGGGIEEWLWKGGDGTPPVAEIDATVFYPDGIMPLRYRLRLAMVGQRMQLVDEAIENERMTGPDENDVYFFYRYQNGNPVLNVRAFSEDDRRYAEDEEDDDDDPRRMKRFLRREDLIPDQSVLSQRKDPDQYPEIASLVRNFGNIHMYREWQVGRYTAPRMPQKADLPEHFLMENARNLGLVLNDLQHQPAAKRKIIEQMRKLHAPIEDITTKIQGGTVQIFVHERGLQYPIPATRLSDGTLRYLCLLTILCHPNPPPLICIDEPELGLHPEILPVIAELMVEASQRTQLIIATHSIILASVLSDLPEALMVCENDGSGTRIRRLESQEMSRWLEDYLAVSF